MNDDEELQQLLSRKHPILVKMNISRKNEICEVSSSEDVNVKVNENNILFYVESLSSLS